MARNKRKKRRIRFRPKKMQLLFFAIALVIFMFLLSRMLPDKTVFLKSEKYNITADTKCYTFKQEEYIIINSTDAVNFLYSEGTDISASAVLSDNYFINSNEYIHQKIKAVDFMLANPTIDTKEEFYQFLSEVNARISTLDTAINEAVEKNDETAKNDLLAQKDEAVKELFVLKRAMRYIFTPMTDLKQVKAEYESQLNMKDMPLTLDNLNFTIFGYIFYSIDGYEDALNMDVLPTVTDGYFNYVDRIKPVKKTETGKYIIRSCATDRIVVGIRLPKDVFVSSETGVTEKRDELNGIYNMDKEGGYYHFLFRRIDILDSFPTVTFTTEDKTVLTGNVVDIVMNEDDKVLITALRSNISYFADKNIFKAELNTESYDCYIVPKSSVVETKDGSFITVIKDAASKETIEVQIFKKTGNKVYLKIDDNTELKDGMEILSKGDRPIDTK